MLSEVRGGSSRELLHVSALSKKSVFTRCNHFCQLTHSVKDNIPRSFMMPSFRHPFGIIFHSTQKKFTSACSIFLSSRCAVTQLLNQYTSVGVTVTPWNRNFVSFVMIFLRILLTVPQASNSLLRLC